MQKERLAYCARDAHDLDEIKKWKSVNFIGRRWSVEGGEKTELQPCQGCGRCEQESLHNHSYLSLLL